MAEKVAVRSTKIFWSKLEKKAPKKREKTRAKKKGKTVKIVTLKTSDREIQYQYDVRITLRNMDYK